MDIDTTQDSFRVYVDEGFYGIVKVTHDEVGEIVSVDGPVYPCAASLDDLRVQLIHMANALESPLSNVDVLKRVAPNASINIGGDAPSRSEESIKADGAFNGSGDFPFVRNALEEELTTRAAQAAQHRAEANLDAGLASVTPEVAVTHVPKQADPDLIRAEGEDAAEKADAINKERADREPAPVEEDKDKVDANA